MSLMIEVKYFFFDFWIIGFVIAPIEKVEHFGNFLSLKHISKNTYIQKPLLVFFNELTVLLGELVIFKICSDD